MFNKMILVAQREFLVNVRKRSFLFAVFGMPIFMGVLFAIVLLAELAADETGLDITDTIVGYVDNANIIVDDVASTYENFIAYDTDADARAALDAGREAGGGRDRQWSLSRATARRAVRRQGHLRHGRDTDHRSLTDLHRPGAGSGRDLCFPSVRCWRSALRQACDS